jgi:hypothetical protein
MENWDYSCYCIRPHNQKWKTGTIPVIASVPTIKNGKLGPFLFIGSVPKKTKNRTYSFYCIRPYQQKWKTGTIPVIVSVPTHKKGKTGYHS